MGLSRFSMVSQVPGAGCQNFLSLEKGGIPCGRNGAMSGVALFKLVPGLLLTGRIGTMGKVGIGGGGSSTMELTGVALLRVLRTSFVQKGQESLLFQVDGVLSSWGWLTWCPNILQWLNLGAHDLFMYMHLSHLVFS